SRMPCAVVVFAGAVALAAVPGCRRFQPAPLSPADSATVLESRSLADPEASGPRDRGTHGDRDPRRTCHLDGAQPAGAADPRPGVGPLRAPGRMSRRVEDCYIRSTRR